MAFRDVLRQHGHRRIVELLARSIERQALPPSLVFAGPPEAGKRLTATAVAQALNCLHLVRDSSAPGGGLALDACGTCAQCVRIARGVHPDVAVIEPAENGAIRIDQVREIIDHTAYRPFEGRRRVAILDDADALVPAAQNALLKTLEEPPASSVFVLVTPRPDVLLPTVRSRCIRLTFAYGVHPGLDPEAREVAHRVLTRAATATDPRRLDGAKELLTKTGMSAAADRDQVGAHLQAMAVLLRDIEAIAAKADDAVLANPDMKAALERLVPAYQRDRGVAAFAAVDRALEAIDRNAGVKVVADWLVLQL